MVEFPKRIEILIRQINRRISIILILAILLVSCVSEKSHPPNNLVISSDSSLAIVATKLLPDIADRSGLELHYPVKLERRTREDLERYLEFKLDEDLPVKKSEFISESYWFFGMLPRDMNLRAVLKELYLEQVVGFYEPDSTTLFVIDDQPPNSLEPLLVHELVHAIQDQVVDLDSISDPSFDNDRKVAAMAAIEGHATLVMFEFQAGSLNLTRDENIHLLHEKMRDEMHLRSPVLASAPLVIQESILFPYLYGAGFVENLWEQNPERPAPFGSQLPISTEQVIHPERFLGDPQDHPVALEIITPTGWEKLYDDNLGELETGILLETHTGSRMSAEGWDGDRYLLLDNGNGSRALVWVIVWDSEIQRDRFVKTLTPNLKSFPVEASLDLLDLDGQPGARLVIGGGPSLKESLSILSGY